MQYFSSLFSRQQSPRSKKHSLTLVTSSQTPSFKRKLLAVQDLLQGWVDPVFLFPKKSCQVKSDQPNTNTAWLVLLPWSSFLGPME